MVSTEEAPKRRLATMSRPSILSPALRLAASSAFFCHYTRFVSFCLRVGRCSFLSASLPRLDTPTFNPKHTFWIYLDRLWCQGHSYFQPKHTLWIYLDRLWCHGYLRYFSGCSMPSPKKRTRFMLWLLFPRASHR